MLKSFGIFKRFIFWVQSWSILIILGNNKSHQSTINTGNIMINGGPLEGEEVESFPPQK